MNHHAYLCQLDTIPVNCASILPLDLANWEREDLVHDTLGIEEVRKLTQKSYLAPSQGDYRIISVLFKTITVEAQQALLKLTEEPPKSTKLVFVTGKGVSFLPTLLSRLAILKVAEATVEDSEWQDFLSLDLVGQMELIAKKIDSKDQDWLIKIKTGLGFWLQRQVTVLSGIDRSSLYFVFKNLGQRGSANKMLLEEMTLILRKFKEKL